VLADDTLSSCGGLDLDQVCGNVSYNPDELEMHTQVGNYCQFVPTCSEVKEYFEKMTVFYIATHVSQRT
jgi:hypothetical protein